MYTSLLVPLDGSPDSERALPLAMALARRSAATVELVHVHEPFGAAAGAPMYDTRFDTEVRQAMLGELQAVADRLPRVPDVRVVTTFLDGPVTPTLQEYVTIRQPALIVMTTHGRGGLSRLWLGSVADALVRHAGAPVLLVRWHPTPTAPVPVAAEEPVFRHVVVPLDGSELAETILDHALSLGTPDETTYTLVTVVAPAPALAYSSPPGGALTDPGDLERRRDEARAYLDEVAKELRRLGAMVTVRMVVHRHPAAAILAIAEETSADLIALSTRGRGGTSRLVLGSVADKLVRGAHASVLLLRPPWPSAPDTSADTGLDRRRQ